MTTNIYILRLQGGRFYVGKSSDTTKRYQEHLEGKGAAWTKKYKPVALERVITNASPFDEDKYTKELMAKHGIEKVRGGAYVSEVLEEFQEEALRREIWGASNKCTLCGRTGHFVKDCYARTDVEGNEIVSDSESESEILASPAFYNPFYSLRSMSSVQEGGPVRKVIEKKPEVAKGPAINKVIEKKPHVAKVAVMNKVIEKKPQACFRCGRLGHFVSDCYARTHTRGYELSSDSESE